MIKIDDEYYINIDECNYSVGRVFIYKSGRDKGKSKFSAEGYYRSLEDALRGYHRIKANKALAGVDGTLADALAIYKETTEEVVKMIRRAVPSVEVDIKEE